MKNIHKFSVSSFDERKEFYEFEFDIKKVKHWFKENGVNFPQICAIDAGSESGIIVDRRLKGNMLYFRFYELERKIKKYIPEDVYYDRNYYENPEREMKILKFRNWKAQELVFDIDSDNIRCNHEKNKQVCQVCLKKAYYWSLKMKKELKEKFNFERVEIVYSGRGFHIHVFDKKGFLLSIKERKKIVSYFKRFPIDPWVSSGNISLIRLPYSLHGLVSRIVMPVNSDNIINELKECAIPNFLKS